MASPIARIPPGLLDLLLTQQLGRNPSELLDTVQPVIEMTPFYAAERLEVRSIVNLTTLPGIEQGQIAVPAGESWIVHQVGLRISYVTAAQNMTVSLILSGIDSDPHFLGDFGDYNGYNLDPGFANQVMYSSITLPPKLIVPSGATFQIDMQRLNLDGQTNISSTLTVLHSRMES